jgi:hypothetical protein
VIWNARVAAVFVPSLYLNFNNKRAESTHRPWLAGAAGDLERKGGRSLFT